MATSPDFLRLATSATRALADVVLDNLRDAVLVADARQPHLPLVLANTTARRCLAGAIPAAQFIETPLARLLGAISAERIDITLASLGDAEEPSALTWRFAYGEQCALTNIKPLACTTGQRLVMLSFAPPVSRLAQHEEGFRLAADAADGVISGWDSANGIVHRSHGVRELLGIAPEDFESTEGAWLERLSEKVLRAATNNTADMLCLIDTALRVRFINKSLNGLTKQQIIGRDIRALLPEPARAGVIAKLAHLLETGDAATFEFESIDDEGARHFENRAVLVRDAGITTGISISMRDITERKRLEQEILDVSGRERQSIGRDLHDGLGQELTGIALMLRGLAGRIQQHCPDVVQNVNEIIGHLNQSIDTARALARGVPPVRAETGGLTCALRALAERSRDLYGLEVSFRAEVCPEFAPSETNASHVYRIAQEALTNAARHGGATLVDIFLAATATAFSLRITDNGEGFARATEPSNGMGLKIMKYRADMIGAKFEIEPNEPHGAVITVAG